MKNSWCCFEKFYLSSNNIRIFHTGQNTKGILETIPKDTEEIVGLTALLFSASSVSKRKKKKAILLYIHLHFK